MKSFCCYAMSAVALCFTAPAALSQPSSGRIQPSQSPETNEFTDPTYGYSVRLPVAWKSYSGIGVVGRRIMLATPNQNTLVISISRLPRPVKSRAEFETIGQTQVDRIVAGFLSSFGIKSLRDQKDDRSNLTSMRFWQGTSGFHASGAPAMLLSLHAIQYGSGSMVNIAYISGHDSKEEVAAVDAIMKSLVFTN